MQTVWICYQSLNEHIYGSSSDTTYDYWISWTGKQNHLPDLHCRFTQHPKQGFDMLANLILQAANKRRHKSKCTKPKGCTLIHCRVHQQLEMNTPWGWYYKATKRQQLQLPILSSNGSNESSGFYCTVNYTVWHPLAHMLQNHLHSA